MPSREKKQSERKKKSDRKTRKPGKKRDATLTSSSTSSDDSSSNGSSSHNVEKAVDQPIKADSADSCWSLGSHKAWEKGFEAGSYKSEKDVFANVESFEDPFGDDENDDPLSSI